MKQLMVTMAESKSGVKGKLVIDDKYTDELNFRLMRVINFENLHILTQNHSFTIPIDNGR
ncbi:MAG: hypothetical protein LWX02_12895 [Deltaproteobacteria bacterium]|jgi:hypothetical protein|nr:hypothetical protein [Deltaproteobacteria bacterium]MDL1986872.1 hypothetical protein [Deltaproteobacteria bacterium]